MSLTNAEIVTLHKECIKYVKENSYDKAIEYYAKIIKAEPNNIYSYYNELGEIYEKKGMFYEAIVNCYIHIISHNKDDAFILHKIGICYFNLHQFKLALHYFKKIVIRHPLVDIYTNMSTCYVNLKEYINAENTLNKAYDIEKNNVRLLIQLNKIHYYLKNYDKSIYYFNKYNSLKINDKVENDTIKYNTSFVFLGKKNFKTGFELYETRLEHNNSNSQTGLIERVEVPIDNWNGKDKCDRLLVIYEQGYGDNIQYYRFIIELSIRYPEMKIDYFCKKEIQHIFKEYGNISIIDTIIIHNYNYKLFIMSLPYMLNLTTIVPNNNNYINVNNKKLLYWNEKCSKIKKFKVGFVYNGLLSSFIEKNIPLLAFDILAELDIELICLHKKDSIRDDIESLDLKENKRLKEKITFFEIDNDVPFEDTICLLQNIDLLLTIDTFIVHLAGVLNVKTWLLLGKYSEWRWSDTDSTYWYNSVELLRVKEEIELKSILHTEVKPKLIDLIKNKNKNNVSCPIENESNEIIYI